MPRSILRSTLDRPSPEAMDDCRALRSAWWRLLGPTRDRRMGRRARCAEIRRDASSDRPPAVSALGSVLVRRTERESPTHQGRRWWLLRLGAGDGSTLSWRTRTPGGIGRLVGLRSQHAAKVRGMDCCRLGRWLDVLCGAGSLRPSRKKGDMALYARTDSALAQVGAVCFRCATKSRLSQQGRAGSVSRRVETGYRREPRGTCAQPRHLRGHNWNKTLLAPRTQRAFGNPDSIS